MINIFPPIIGTKNANFCLELCENEFMKFSEDIINIRFMFDKIHLTHFSAIINK